MAKLLGQLWDRLFALGWGLYVCYCAYKYAHGLETTALITIVFIYWRVDSVLSKLERA